ncbi:MAG: ATP-binding protein, partial [Pseudomonadales bacterium]|nr:ATP-binding protein [Pseudomonadales bacterium]
MRKTLDALRNRRSSADLVPATHVPSARPARPSEPLGRATVRAELRDTLRSAADGHSAFVVLSGPPGIGKSLLLDHLARGARLDGFERLTIQPRRDGRRDEQSLLPKALLPIAERAAHPAAASALARLKAEMDQATAALESTALRMAPTLQLAGTTERFEDALRELLRTLCTAQRPLLLLIEDCEQLEAESFAQLARITAFGDIPHLLTIASTRAPDRVAAILKRTLD